MKKTSLIVALLFVLLTAIGTAFANDFIIKSDTTTALRTEDIIPVATEEGEWKEYTTRNPGGVCLYSLTTDGDARYRIHYDHQTEKSAQDYRVRFGLGIGLNDEVGDGLMRSHSDVYIRLNTGSQQVDGVTDDTALVDRAYLNVEPNQLPGLNIQFGKVGLPFVTPGNSRMLLDDDTYSAEGITSQYFIVNNARTVSAFANGGYFSDVFNGGQAGVQVGDKTNMVVGVGFYDFRDIDLSYREAFCELRDEEVGSLYGDYAITTGDNKVSWLAGAELKLGKISADYNYRELKQVSPYSNIDFPFENGHAITLKSPVPGVPNLEIGITHYADWEFAKNESIAGLTYQF